MGDGVGDGVGLGVGGTNTGGIGKLHHAPFVMRDSVIGVGIGAKFVVYVPDMLVRVTLVKSKLTVTMRKGDDFERHTHL